jgi:hypothetical protein
VRTTPGAAGLDKAALAARGLSVREIDELLIKLSPAAVPDFELDVSKAKSGAHFAERYAAAVPKADAQAAAKGDPAPTS